MPGVLLVGCGDIVEPVAIGTTPSIPGNDQVIIHGEILEVMESWPLQLLVQSRGRSLSLSLSETTTVSRAGRTESPGALAPGQKVAVTTSAGEAGIAQSIDIQSL